MGFTFGTKKSEIVETSSNYLRNFKKGETKVRFLQESGDWHGYFEHFMDGKSFPCMEMDECPGCKSDNDQVRRRARRYGTFVWLVEQKRVLPFKIGAKLNERLTIRAERNGGTLLNRDYVIIRSGSGLETDYDVDQDERYEFDTASAWKNRGDMEIQDILAEQFIALFGDPEQLIKNSKSEMDFAGKNATVTSTSGAGTTFTVNAGSDAPPFDSTKKDENVEVGIDDLKKMKRSQLVQVWKEAGFDGFDEDWDNEEIVREILKRAN